MINLSTNYMGMNLRNPLVASASPLCENIDNLKMMEDSGFAAVVLHSLFEEQLTQEKEGTSGHFPDMQDYNLGPDGYLEHIRAAKAAVGIPIIASINAASTGSWVKYAQLIEQAGADALELNIYFIATNFEKPGNEIEQDYLEILSGVKQNVKIPVAVKLNPFFSSLPYMARQLEKAGANALVLFNRFYMPDFDLENREVVPNLVLSNSNEVLQRLHWIAILFGNVNADLAITGGVHTAKDVVKSVMAGANVVMMTSALMKYGIPHVMHVLTDLFTWFQEHEYETVKQIRGSMSRRSAKDRTVFERANYMKMLSSYVPRMP